MVASTSSISSSSREGLCHGVVRECSSSCMRQPDQQASYYVAVYMTAPPHVLRMHEGRIVTSLEFPETLVILCNRTDLGIRGRHVHDVRVSPRQARCGKFIPAICAFVRLCIQNILPFS